MQCLLTALKAESQPLIDNFDLKKDLSFPFPVFKRDDLYLIGIGVGKRKIKDRIDAFYQSINHEIVQFINVGIAGGNHSSTKIGACYLLHKIKDETTGKTYYPDILIKHNFEEKSLVTVQKGISNGGNKFSGLVDMEALEIFKICSSHIPVHRMAFLKIVSDPMDLDVVEFTFHKVSGLVSSKLKEIENFITEFKNLLSTEKPILNKSDFEWIHSISNHYSITETQQQQLIHRSKGFRLRNQIVPFPEINQDKPKSKTDRNQIFKNICAELSA
mgnify:CR=1 FL=1